MIRFLLIILILTALTNYSWSQVDPHKYILTIPFEQSENLDKDLDINKNKIESPYSIIDANQKNFFAYKKHTNSDIRVFKILKEKEDYFVLCNEDEDICECKAGTFIYLKPQEKLQRIEKAFSFSLKNNLIDRLKKFDISHIQKDDERTFCEILEAL